MRRIAIVMLLCLAGCAPLQNLTADDIRKPEYLSETRTFPLTLDEVEHALYLHDEKCRLTSGIRRNPTNKSEGVISVVTPVIVAASVTVLVDLKQHGSTTEAKGYSVPPSSAHDIRTIFSAIENPTTCQ